MQAARKDIFMSKLSVVGGFVELTAVLSHVVRAVMTTEGLRS